MVNAEAKPSTRTRLTAESGHDLGGKRGRQAGEPNFQLIQLRSVYFWQERCRIGLSRCIKGRNCNVQSCCDPMERC